MKRIGFLGDEVGVHEGRTLGGICWLGNFTLSLTLSLSQRSFVKYKWKKKLAEFLFIQNYHYKRTKVLFIGSQVAFEFKLQT